jgi:hypothetical protein
MTRIKDIYKPAEYQGAPLTLHLKYLRVGLSHLNMSPPYQRGHVWTQPQQELFMGHLLSGGEVLPIIIHRPVCITGDEQDELLDGKQRLTAILAWLDGKIGARVEDQLVFVGDLDSISPLSITAKYINIPSFENRKKFYVRLNTAGTPHTKEEIEAALAAKEST